MTKYSAAWYASYAADAAASAAISAADADASAAAIAARAARAATKFANNRWATRAQKEKRYGINLDEAFAEQWQETYN